MRRVHRCGPRGGKLVRPLAESIEKGFVSKLRMAMKETLGKEEDWDQIETLGNTRSSPLVESYPTFVNNPQKQAGVPVKQAAPLLTHDIAKLLQDLRQRAQSRRVDVRTN